MSKSRGFTLIELLVVISIIAILSVVGFVAYQNVTSKAKDAKMKADIDAIKKAYETNYVPEGQGRYQPLADSQFASGKIPTQPNGNSYPCVVGPPGSGCGNNSDQGYQVSVILSNGTSYAAVSTQGTLASSGAMNSCGDTLRNGLVGYWKMDEAPVPDSSGNGHSGSLQNGVNIITPSHTQSFPDNLPLTFANAADFSGGYIDTGTKFPSINKSAITVSAWVKPGSSQTGYADIWGNHQDDGTGPKGIVMQNNSGTNIFGWGYGNGTGWEAGSGTVELTANIWQYVVAVKRQDDPHCYMFVNGSQRSSGSCSGNIVPATIINFGIGRGYPWESRVFNGQIDDVRIYDRGLTDNEITQLYNNGAGCI